MTHLNLLENATQTILTSTAIFDIPGAPSSIHDVELQYVDDEDVDPFEDL